jgi:hypothetical protein
MIVVVALMVAVAAINDPASALPPACFPLFEGINYPFAVDK